MISALAGIIKIPPRAQPPHAQPRLVPIVRQSLPQCPRPPLVRQPLLGRPVGAASLSGAKL